MIGLEGQTASSGPGLLPAHRRPVLSARDRLHRAASPSKLTGAEPYSLTRASSASFCRPTAPPACRGTGGEGEVRHKAQAQE